MLSLAVAGFLAGAVAAAIEVLVLAPPDRDLRDWERTIRFIGAAYVAGDAVLGVVLGFLAIELHPTVEPSSLQAAISATAIIAAALGVASTWRLRPRPERPELERTAGSSVLLRYSAFQAIGIIGFLVGCIAVFIG